MSTTAKNIDVLVLCGGKCGSTTLATTFQKNGYKCLKVHSATNYIAQFKKDELYKTIDISSKNKKLYIIDCYRTPIERKISSFFENIHKHLPNYKNLTNQQIIKIFNDKFLEILENYHSINATLDKYDVPHWSEFDFNKKYNITTKGNLIFIKILFKDIQSWDTILSEIIGKKIKIFNDNLSKNKPTHKLYQRFKEAYKPPIQYIQNVIPNDVEFQIYNTEEDQEKYIKKWSDIANRK